MDVGSSQRFEIELEEQAPKRSRFRSRPEPAIASEPVGFRPPDGEVVFTPAPTTDTQPDESDRNRLVVTALAVGAVALFLGWSIGRAGGDGDGDAAAQTGGTTATTEATDEASEEPGPATTVEATGDTLPEASLPSTTRPRPATTTTTTLPPAWGELQVEIDTRLTGQADRIVAVADERTIVDLDLANGTMRRLDTPRSRGATPLPPVAGDDWVALSFDDGNAPIVYRDDDPDGAPTGMTDPWSLLWHPSTGTVWQQRWDSTGRSEGLVEYTIDGDATGRTIETRGLWVSRIDFRGGFVIGDGSIGAYSVSPEGSQRLADGYVLAVGLNHVFVYNCAESFDSCGFGVVDRTTGETREVPVGGDLVDDLLGGNYWGPVTTPLVNVDGTAALVTVPDANGPPQVAVLDLVAGELVWQSEPALSFSGASYASGVWSEDGRFAYVAQDDALVAVDRTSGDTFEVVVDGSLSGVRSVTARPTVGG